MAFQLLGESEQGFGYKTGHHDQHKINVGKCDILY